MCRRNVILFECGHTRLLNFECEDSDRIVCHKTKRILIPESGGIGIEAPIQKDKWRCAFKCVPGVPAHDPLIEQAKENVDAVKNDIERRIDILSVLSTPTSSIWGENASFDLELRSHPSLGRQSSTLTSSQEKSTFNTSPAVGNKPRADHDEDSTDSPAQSPRSQDTLRFTLSDLELCLSPENIPEASNAKKA